MEIFCSHPKFYNIYYLNIAFVLKITTGMCLCSVWPLQFKSAISVSRQLTLKNSQELDKYITEIGELFYEYFELHGILLFLNSTVYCLILFSAFET